MCLIILATKSHKKFPFIFAANRDEFYERPTAKADFRTEHPQMLAGKDLKDGGTWLGITREGKFAAITNFRDLSIIKDNAPSRGNIVKNFLVNEVTTKDYSSHLISEGKNYNGFNFIYGDVNSLNYYSNVTNSVEEIPDGVHGLSNHLLNTPWAKVEMGKEKIKIILNQTSFDETDLLKLLNDTRQATDNSLPDTGIGLELERLLSPMFIKSEKYGTRCSTVILIDTFGNVSFTESTFNHLTQKFELVKFNFKLE